MSNLTITDFSNYGTAVDFVAPGHSIVMIAPKSIVNTGCGIGSGTSQATAYMTSAISNILSYNNNFTNEQVCKILEYYAEDLGNEGKDVYYGNGFVNFNNVVECTCNSTECEEIYCFGCTSSQCIYHEATVVTLESIAITTEPTKKVYTEGEVFDPAGMVVTAAYSDGSKKNVEGYTWSPNGQLKTTDTTITVSYIEGEITKTATVQGITVNAKVVEPPVIEPPEKILESIAITTQPTKKVYTEGEIFNQAGMVVTATYSDNSTAVVTDYTYSPQGALTVENTTITVSYTEGDITKTATVQGITVNAKVVEPPVVTLESIEITTQATKKVYTEGERFEPAGMVVTAIYSDNSKKVVTNYDWNPKGELTTENKTITISYKEGEITKTETLGITVNAKVVEPPVEEPPEKILESIAITTQPTKKVYTEGEKFNPAGMVVTAYYSDGSSKIIENYNCFPIGELKKSNTIITVQYTENGKNVSKTIQIVVNSKNISNNDDGNGNNNDNNNENDIINNTVVDNTIKNDNLVFTGAEDYIIPIIIIALIGVCSFIKYRQYKDI